MSVAHAELSEILTWVAVGVLALGFVTALISLGIFISMKVRIYAKLSDDRRKSFWNRDDYRETNRLYRGYYSNSRLPAVFGVVRSVAIISVLFFLLLWIYMVLTKKW